jgi:hypothetical protein
MIILFWSTMLLAIYAPCQTNECPALINIDTQKWTIDSLGTRGYRQNNFKMLRNCNPKAISKALLIDKLGRPNRVEKFSSGITRKNHVEYIYFIQNIYPEDEKQPFEGLFISYIFDENENTLEEISHGNLCG